jgi:ABC-type glycerol-3-phosphate transport system substrate-binding protein
MKKNLLSIAILAAGLLVASCGNKQAAPAPEAPVADSEASAGLPELKTTIDKNSFSFAIPEGWQSMPGDDEGGDKEGAMVYKGKDATELMSAAFMMISVGDDEGKTLDEGIKEFQEDAKATAIDDVTIGGKTYKAFTATESGMESTFLLAHEGRKFIAFIIGKASAEDPEVRAIVNSFKLK